MNTASHVNVTFKGINNCRTFEHKNYLKSFKANCTTYTVYTIQ